MFLRDFTLLIWIPSPHPRDNTNKATRFHNVLTNRSSKKPQKSFWLTLTLRVSQSRVWTKHTSCGVLEHRAGQGAVTQLVITIKNNLGASVAACMPLITLDKRHRGPPSATSPRRPASHTQMLVKLNKNCTRKRRQTQPRPSGMDSRWEKTTAHSSLLFVEPTSTPYLFMPYNLIFLAYSHKSHRLVTWKTAHCYA